MASKSEAFRERSRSPVAQAKADEPQDLEIVLEPLLPDSQEPPAVFDHLIERIIFNAVADNQMAALRGLPQIDIEALRKELESFGNGPTPVSEWRANSIYGSSSISAVGVTPAGAPVLSYHFHLHN